MQLTAYETLAAHVDNLDGMITQVIYYFCCSYSGSIQLCTKQLESMADPSVRAVLCCHLANATDLLMPVLRNYREWVGLNYGPIFHRWWTKVHQITSADAGEIVVCNAVFQLSISCSVLEIFAI